MSTPNYSTHSDEKRISKESSLVSLNKVELSDEEVEAEADFERRTMRFVDIRIIPLLAMLYSFALIDRINLGAANTAGMAIDLDLNVDGRFNLITCLYFVPYTILQLPGTTILRKVGVRRVMTSTVIAWGLVQLSMGFIHQWGFLVLTRILLGIFESAFFPGLLFIISTWYKRHEVQKRLAVFYLISVTASGLSPLLALVFSFLDGHRGISGWQWIFILEGIITLVLGIVCWLFVPDFPDKNTFLTPKQTELVLRRIEEDRGDSIPDPLDVRKVLLYLRDWKLWAYGVIFLCATMPNYAQSYFISIILNKGFGWSTTKSLLLSAPPYGPSIIVTMTASYFSDKYKHRSSFIIVLCLVCVLGLSLTAFAKENSVRYFGIFLTNAGNSGAIPGILAFASNNVVSQSKRSVQSALTVALGGIGGIMSSTIFRAQDYPRYIPGLSVTMGSQVVLLSLMAALILHFRKENRLMREGKRDKPIEGQPGFYYTL